MSVFHKAKQDQGETIEQFVTKLHKLALHCKYAEMTDENIRDQVIDGCKSAKLRRKLLTETELTVQKTIEIGKILESTTQHNEQLEQQQQKGDYKDTFNSKE